jgi:hypothetical protein
MEAVPSGSRASRACVSRPAPRRTLRVSEDAENDDGAVPLGDAAAVVVADPLSEVVIAAAVSCVVVAASPAGTVAEPSDALVTSTSELSHEESARDPGACVMSVSGGGWESIELVVVRGPARLRRLTRPLRGHGSGITGGGTAAWTSAFAPVWTAAVVGLLASCGAGLFPTRRLACVGDVLNVGGS